MIVGTQLGTAQEGVAWESQFQEDSSTPPPSGPGGAVINAALLEVITLPDVYAMMGLKGCW